MTRPRLYFLIIAAFIAIWCVTLAASGDQPPPRPAFPTRDAESVGYDDAVTGLGCNSVQCAIAQLEALIGTGGGPGGPLDQLTSAAGTGKAKLISSNFQIILDPHAAISLPSFYTKDGDTVAVSTGIGWFLGSNALTTFTNGVIPSITGIRGNASTHIAPVVNIAGFQSDGANACLKMDSDVFLCVDRSTTPDRFFIDLDRDGIKDSDEKYLADTLDSSALLVNQGVMKWDMDAEPDRPATSSCSFVQDPDQPTVDIGIACEPPLNSGVAITLRESDAAGGTDNVKLQANANLAASVAYTTDTAGKFPRRMVDAPSRCFPIETTPASLFSTGLGEFAWQPIYTAMNGDDPPLPAALEFACSCARKAPGMGTDANQCHAQFDIQACQKGAMDILSCGTLSTTKRLKFTGVRCSEDTEVGPAGAQSGWCNGSPTTACANDGVCGANGPCNFTLRDDETLYVNMPVRSKCLGGTQAAQPCTTDANVQACNAGGGECAGPLVCYGGTAAQGTTCTTPGADAACTGSGECRPTTMASERLLLCLDAI